MAFLTTKYYPVDLYSKVIINTPKRRERDCCAPGERPMYVGIKGKSLNSFTCYASFEVRQSKEV